MLFLNILVGLTIVGIVAAIVIGQYRGINAESVGHTVASGIWTLALLLAVRWLFKRSQKRVDSSGIKP